MADDTRQSKNADGTQNPHAPFDPNRNADRTGHWRPRVLVHKLGEETASDQEAKKDVGIRDVAGTFQSTDFVPSQIVKIPCFREAFLPGIGGGFAAGAVRFLAYGPSFHCYSWGLGACGAIAVTVHQLCQRRRRKDKEGIKQVIKVIEEKEAMKGVERRIEAAESRTKGATPSKSSPMPVGPIRTAQPDKQSPSFWSTFKFW